MMARPKGTTKEDSLLWLTVTIGLTKETVQWYKSLPDGMKGKAIRDAITLYRARESTTIDDDEYIQIVNRDIIGQFTDEDGNEISP